MAEQLARQQSRRLQGLSPDSPPIVKGQEGITMEQLASGNVPVGNTLASEIREEFTVFTNPLVQLPPAADVFMHSPFEGRVDSLTPPDYGLDAPFWRTSMGQAIVEFGVIIPSPGNPPSGEEE